MSEQSSQADLPGMIVVLSGPAGVGKSTVGELLLERHPEMTRVITATTRQPRGQEVDGVDYHFYTREAFERDVAAGLFLEHAEVHGNLYGAPLKSVVGPMREGKVVLAIIDVDGGAQVDALDLDACLIFLEAPSREELVERLTGRGTEDQAAVSKRLERVERELAAGANYPVRIVNDDLERCAAEVYAAVTSARAALAAKRDAGETLYPGLAKLPAV